MMLTLLVSQCRGCGGKAPDRFSQQAVQCQVSTVVSLNSDGMKCLTTPIYTLLSNILVSALKKVSN